MDRLFWQAGWVEKPQELFREDLSQALAGKGWICDGNYSSSLEFRLSRADTLIWLDFPRWRCLWRVVRRIATYWGRTRPDIADGCKEQLDWSFLVYVWRFKRHKRPQLERLFADTRNRLIQVHLKSPADVNAFMASLQPD